MRLLQLRLPQPYPAGASTALPRARFRRRRRKKKPPNWHANATNSGNCGWSARSRKSRQTWPRRRRSCAAKAAAEERGRRCRAAAKKAAIQAAIERAKAKKAGHRRTWMTCRPKPSQNRRNRREASSSQDRRASCSVQKSDEGQGARNELTPGRKIRRQRHHAQSAGGSAAGHRRVRVFFSARRSWSASPWQALRRWLPKRRCCTCAVTPCGPISPTAARWSRPGCWRFPSRLWRLGGWWW